MILPSQWAWLGELLRSSERFLLPNVCIHCDAMVSTREPDALVCGICLSRMRGLGVGCARCSQPLPPVGPCRFCADWTDSLREVRSAVWLGGEARAVVHMLKYGHARTLGGLAADIIARRVVAPSGGVLVAVPVSQRRFRERGYNQAELIARALGVLWSMPVWPTLLQRRLQTRSQTALTPKGRAANVSDAFLAEPPRGAVGGERRVYIIDDVLTTGATISACAEALAEAGWRQLAAITFARAMPFEFQAGGHQLS